MTRKLSSIVSTKYYLAFAATLAIALSYTSTVTASGLDKQQPMIQLFKDDQIIQSRMMTEEELAAYQQLDQIEDQMENFEGPMEDLEEQLEAKVEALEDVLENARENGFGGRINREHQDDLAGQTHSLGAQITALTTAMQPSFDKMHTLGRQIEVAANDFKDLIDASAEGVDYDMMQVVDSNGKASFHFGQFNMDDDNDSDW
ncbi:MAG: hypothetical protein ACI8WB_001441 [Phenylobacterium sp.]|jgi:hypothetical protein